MDQAEAGKKQQTERIAQLIEQRAQLANELKAAEQAQHEAYELVKPAAEAELAQRQERAAIARELIVEKRQEKGRGREHQRGRDSRNGRESVER